MTGTTDPVVDGVITSLARPGGNITGLSVGGNELYGKRLELLKEAVPKASRVAVFWYRTSANEPSWLKEMPVSGRALGLQIQPVEVQIPNDFAAAFESAIKGGARSLTVAAHPIFTGNRIQILTFTAKNRLPAISVEGICPRWRFNVLCAQVS
jgi:putative ABC transport system substrate-binding protein